MSLVFESWLGVRDLARLADDEVSKVLLVVNPFGGFSQAVWGSAPSLHGTNSQTTSKQQLLTKRRYTIISIMK